MSLLEDKFLKNLVYIAGVAIAFAVIQVITSIYDKQDQQKDQSLHCLSEEALGP